MAYLRDLDVTKVSFVRRAANKRQFLLLKSDEKSDGEGEGGTNNNNPEEQLMRPEVKAKLQEILKSERQPDKVVELLKADTVLKATEQELTEVQEILVMTAVPPPAATPPTPAPTPAQKSSEEPKEYQELQKANEELQKQIVEMRDSQRRRDVVQILKSDCALAPINVEETADLIMRLEKVDKKAAEAHIESLKKASVALKEAKTFSEGGSSRESSSAVDALAGQFTAKIEQRKEEVQKSGEKVKPSDVVIAAVNDMGAANYENYRREHILRAKLEAV